MVALAAPVHDHVDVGSPFYAGGPRPGLVGGGQPVFHKYDNPDFVNGFLKDVAGAAQSRSVPASMLPVDVATQDGTLPDFDVDAYDYLGNRYRKLYQPAHFRFYLAACQLRCLVPGFPAPSTVKKVEMVIRRVAIGKHASASAPPFAWVPVPDPSQFPRLPPADTPPMALAPRLTGNTHTWWPMVSADQPFPDEQRYPMTRVPRAAFNGGAVYFGYLPLASGEMWGPKAAPDADPGNFGKPPAPPDPATVVLDAPLIKAPSSFALAPPIMRNWLKNAATVLNIVLGKKSTGPRPKFESPRLHDDNASDGFAYLVQCVATLEPKPGCLVEQWGAPSLPFLVAPHFDPFGGRPTNIEVPTLKGLKKMLNGITSPAQFAQRAPGVGLKYNDCPPQPDGSKNFVSMVVPGDGKTCPSPNGAEICFQGIPLFTIAAYLMFAIALVILFLIAPLFVSILLLMKFCIPIGPSE